MRAVLYDALKLVDNVTKTEIYMPDGLHPARVGQLIWADVMISLFKMLVQEIMEELLLKSVDSRAYLPQNGKLM
jgi:hypothetical protein